MKELDRNEKSTAFLNSISVAKLAQIVIGALGGRQASSSVKFDDLMPFKSAEVFESDEASLCTPQSKAVLTKLVKQGKIPVFLIPSIREDLT